MFLCTLCTLYPKRTKVHEVHEIMLKQNNGENHVPQKGIKMTVKDAAAATGISQRTIRAHIHKGTLPAVQLINGRYDIRSRDLFEWHVWMYRTSRATMFPSWRSEKFVRDFGLCERQKPIESNE